MEAYHEVPVVHRSVHLLDIQVREPSWARSDCGSDEVWNAVLLASGQLVQSSAKRRHEVCKPLTLRCRPRILVVDVTASLQADNQFISYKTVTRLEEHGVIVIWS